MWASSKPGRIRPPRASTVSPASPAISGPPTSLMCPCSIAIAVAPGFPNTVPLTIARSATAGSYAADGRDGGLRYDQQVIELRSATEIEAMRPAGRFVAEVLTELEPRVKPGINLLELDAIAAGMIRDRGASSCYVDYHPSFGAMPFGKVLCTS